MGASNSYGLGLVFLRLEVSKSYVWGLVLLRLVVRDSYVWGLRISTFGGWGFLSLGVSFLTFGG